MDKLAAVLDSLDDVDAALHKYYTEVDGKFYLNLDGSIRDHTEVKALKNAHERQKAQNKTLQTELNTLKEKYKDFPEDLTVEELERLRALDDEGGTTPEEKRKKQQERTAEIERRIEERVARVKAAAEKERDEAKAARDAALAELDNVTVNNALNEALDAAGIESKFRPAVRALLRPKVKVVREDGEPSRAIVETELNPETPVSKFVSEWTGTDEGKVYVSEPSGSGSKGSPQRGSSVVNPWKAETLNRTRQGQILRDNPTLARRLQQEAGIAHPV